MRETFVPRVFIITIQNVLSKGLRSWFVEIFFSALTVCGTVSSWILNSNEEKRYRKFYRYLQRLGRFDERIPIAYESRFIGILKDAFKKRTSFDLRTTTCRINGTALKSRARGMRDPTNTVDKSATCYGHSWAPLSLIVEHTKRGRLACRCVGVFTFPKRIWKRSTKRFDQSFKRNLK